ncbi:MAG TPA: hypothetical protein VD735_06315 [Candidatus Saccharimonadales bacterium]|nr:hypothetical protein [Candidatus Saccharimonadales bacterium]
MIHISNYIRQAKYLAVTGIATAALTLGVVAAVPAASASAVSCRVFTPVIAGYEAGMRYTAKSFVPGSSTSGCKDINIRNVQNKQVSGDTCATFKVQFFPTWGQDYYGKAKQVCSKGPNGPVVPIATDVLNGTEYRVWYNVENLSHTHTFQIVD